MKLTVITGSPHKKGTTALLADKFIEGAKEAGHEVIRFDAAFENVKPCLACEYCASHDGECVHKDTMNDLSKQLVETELIVFVTPLYYFGMSAQIKAVIDRFHASNTKIVGNKKAMLLAAAYGADDWTMEGLEKMYESMLRLGPPVSRERITNEKADSRGGRRIQRFDAGLFSGKSRSSGHGF